MLQEELEKARDQLAKTEKSLKTSNTDNMRMRQRIQKLKTKKGRIDQGIEICRNCGKDYNEKENYNWSCRTHYSEYGGEMWWCCLKFGQKALGCKFDKHDCKE